MTRQQKGNKSIKVK